MKVSKNSYFGSMFVALASMQTIHAQNKTVKCTNPLLQSTL
jgi:hypothetical protein